MKERGKENKESIESLNEHVYIIYYIYLNIKIKFISYPESNITHTYIWI